MLRRAWMLIILALFLLGLSACTVRYVTTTYTYSSPERHSLYLFYWEGKCWGRMCLGRGDSRVKRCDIQDDNTATCHQEEEAERALNPE